MILHFALQNSDRELAAFSFFKSVNNISFHLELDMAVNFLLTLGLNMALRQRCCDDLHPSTYYPLKPGLIGPRFSVDLFAIQ